MPAAWIQLKAPRNNTDKGPLDISRKKNISFDNQNMYDYIIIIDQICLVIYLTFRVIIDQFSLPHRYWGSMNNP